MRLYLLALVPLTLCAANEKQSLLAAQALTFEENRGQFPNAAPGAFLARTPGYVFVAAPTGPLFLTANGPVPFTLDGAAPWSAPQPVDRLVRQSNYFRPNLQLTGVPHFASVRYPNVYPGIDLIFKAAGRDVEYDFLVHPHADPRRIAVRLPGPSLRQRPPVAFQQTPRGRVEIPVKARQSGPVTRFRLAAYDPSLPLTIDPVVEASTLLNTEAYDTPLALALDSAGNSILVGRAYNPLSFPSRTGTYQTQVRGYSDIFVTKISADAKTALFTTFYGGDGEDVGTGVAVDAAGNIAVTGYGMCAQQHLLPGSYLAPGSLSGALVVKFNPTGTQLLATACIGGPDGHARSNAIALDPAGNIYIGGSSTTTQLPVTANAVSTGYGSDQAFAAKLNPSATGLLFLTYLGGDRSRVNAIAIDSAANPIFAGTTNAVAPWLYPPAGAYNRTGSIANDGFLLRLNPTGTAILNGTYFGGGWPETLHAIALDAAGNILITGATYSDDFPVSPHSPLPAVVDTSKPATYVAKFNPTATSLLWSILLGGDSGTGRHAITANPDGRIYVTGTGGQGGVPSTPNALITHVPTYAAAASLTQLDAGGNVLDTTYWTGTRRGPTPVTEGSSAGTAIVSSGPGVVTLAGTARVSTFPTTTGAFRPSAWMYGSDEAFVTRFNYNSPCTFTVSPASITAPIGGGTYRATISTTPGCPWVHTSTSNWIGTAALSATEVDITVDPSDLPDRTGYVFIAGKTIPVTQQQPCVYSNPNPVVAVPANGGDFSFLLSSNLRCPITPVTPASWIKPDPMQTTVQGSTSVTVRVFTNHDPAARSATITYAPGLSVRIDQAAATCTYNVSPTTAQVSYDTGSLQVSIQTQDGCAWQAESIVDWISPGSLDLRPNFATPTALLGIGFNNGPLRTGSVRIAGKTITVTQFGKPVGNAPQFIGNFYRYPAGSPQQFTFGGRDQDGAADLNRLQFLVADSPNAAPGNSCYAYYTPANNSLYLYNDNHTAVLGPITRGVAGSLENSFCRLDGATSTPYTSSGTDGLLTLGVSLKGVFGSKQHEVYAWLRDNAGNDTGWNRIDTWKVAPFSQIPAIVTPASPLALAGTPKVIYGQATDGDGPANITRVFFNIGPSSTPSASTCYGYLDNTNNTAVLLDNSAANCEFHSNVTSIVPSGNETNFTLSLNLRGALASGTHSVFVNARDAQGHESGWSSLGAWSPANPPSLDANPPIASSGSDRTFVFTFDHPEGVANLGVVNVLINRFLDGDNACYVAFSQPLNVLYLVNDNGPGSGISAGLTLGGSGSVSNTQCRINAAGSSAVRSGNRLTLTLNVTFLSAFAGSKVIYLAAGAANGTNTGWRTSGAHQVPAPKSYPDAAGLAIPTGTGSLAYPEMVFEDATSANNLQTAWMLINTALDGRAACYVAYYRPGNTLYLIPDNGDGAQAQSMPLAGGNTLSNSQCTVSAQNSTVTVSGNRLTLRLQVQFKPAFAGPKVIWNAVSTLNNAAISPWKAVGAWSVTHQ